MSEPSAKLVERFPVAPTSPLHLQARHSTDLSGHAFEPLQFAHPVFHWGGLTYYLTKADRYQLHALAVTLGLSTTSITIRNLLLWACLLPISKD